MVQSVCGEAGVSGETSSSLKHSGFVGETEVAS
jgi:hypothetical protein